jgi:hypothetical protein
MNFSQKVKDKIACILDQKKEDQGKPISETLQLSDRFEPSEKSMTFSRSSRLRNLRQERFLHKTLKSDSPSPTMKNSINSTTRTFSQSSLIFNLPNSPQANMCKEANDFDVVQEEPLSIVEMDDKMNQIFSNINSIRECRSPRSKAERNHTSQIGSPSQKQSSFQNYSEVNFRLQLHNQVKPTQREAVERTKQSTQNAREKKNKLKLNKFVSLAKITNTLIQDGKGNYPKMKTIKTSVSKSSDRKLSEGQNETTEENKSKKQTQTEQKNTKATDTEKVLAKAQELTDLLATDAKKSKNKISTPQNAKYGNSNIKNKLVKHRSVKSSGNLNHLTQSKGQSKPSKDRIQNYLKKSFEFAQKLKGLTRTASTQHPNHNKNKKQSPSKCYPLIKIYSNSNADKEAPKAQNILQSTIQSTLESTVRSKTQTNTLKPEKTSNHSHSSPISQASSSPQVPTPTNNNRKTNLTTPHNQNTQTQSPSKKTTFPILQYPKTQTHTHTHPSPSPSSHTNNPSFTNIHQSHSRNSHLTLLPSPLNSHSPSKSNTQFHTRSLNTCNTSINKISESSDLNNPLFNLCLVSDSKGHSRNAVTSKRNTYSGQSRSAKWKVLSSGSSPLKTFHQSKTGVMQRDGLKEKNVKGRRKKERVFINLNEMKKQVELMNQPGNKQSCVCVPTKEREEIKDCEKNIANAQNTQTNARRKLRQIMTPQNYSSKIINQKKLKLSFDGEIEEETLQGKQKAKDNVLQPQQRIKEEVSFNSLYNQLNYIKMTQSSLHSPLTSKLTTFT